MLCEINDALLFLTINKEEVNSNFNYACEHEDIIELERICSTQEKLLLLDETILWGARKAVRTNKLLTLQFIIKNFYAKLNIKNLLETAVSYNSQECFDFLTQFVSLTSLQYSSVYDSALTMKFRTSYKHLTP